MTNTLNNQHQQTLTVEKVAAGYFIYFPVGMGGHLWLNKTLQPDF